MSEDRLSEIEAHVQEASRIEYIDRRKPPDAMDAEADMDWLIDEVKILREQLRQTLEELRSIEKEYGRG